MIARILLLFAVGLPALLAGGCSRPDAAVDQPADNPRSESSTPATSPKQSDQEVPSEPKAPLNTEVAKEKPDSRERGPEATLAAFMVAVMTCDKEKIEQLILPNPESSILAEGQPMPPAAAIAARLYFAALSYQRFKVGDTVNLPGGRTLLVTDRLVNADSQFITFSDNPVPFLLVRKDGIWKVDPGPLIAARKGAARARKQGL
jgi:hypothetical protein